jgi:ABC-type molybdate transport system ATPase subunit
MNTLPATLTAITASEHLSILTVAVGEDNFHLLLAEQCHDAIGTPLTLAFKETEVILASTPTATTANIHRAVVSKIEQGSVLSQITLTYHEHTLIALVPTLTFNTLSIDAGDELFWMVSPSEISLLRGHHGS